MEVDVTEICGMASGFWPELCMVRKIIKNIYAPLANLEIN
jgi:hypothetical protein